MKPIIKWVGGKTQIIDKIIADFPREINDYHEPFLGGGSVLLALLTNIKSRVIRVNGSVYAYDLNEPLIYMYKNIQSNYEELYNQIQELISEFNSSEDKEVFYYSIRDRYNKLEDKRTILSSAIFIFLNKTCFRGIYRMSKNGFNVPYGNYKNPEIINHKQLKEMSELIQLVKFECCDFEKSLISIINKNNPADFIYLDPPYAPETSSSFVKYTEKGFDINNHYRLFEMINNLKEIKIMMSNADVSLIHDNFSNDKYKFTSIICKRAINAKNPNSKTRELIIKNY